MKLFQFIGILQFIIMVAPEHRFVVELSYFAIKCYGTFNNHFPFKIVANIMVWIYYHDTTLHVQKASFWKDKVRCISKHYLLEAQPK